MPVLLKNIIKPSNHHRQTLIENKTLRRLIPDVRIIKTDVPWRERHITQNFQYNRLRSFVFSKKRPFKKKPNPASIPPRFASHEVTIPVLLTCVRMFDSALQPVESTVYHDGFSQQISYKAFLLQTFINNLT